MARLLIAVILALAVIGSAPAEARRDGSEGRRAQRRRSTGSGPADLSDVQLDLMEAVMDSCNTDLAAYCSEQAEAWRTKFDEIQDERHRTPPSGGTAPDGASATSSADNSQDASQSSSSSAGTNEDNGSERRLRGEGDRHGDGNEPEHAGMTTHNQPPGPNRGGDQGGEQIPGELRALAMCMREHIEDLSPTCEESVDEFRHAMNDAHQGEADCWIDNDCERRRGNFRWVAPVATAVVAIIVILAILRCRRKRRCCWKPRSPTSPLVARMCGGYQHVESPRGQVVPAQVVAPQVVPAQVVAPPSNGGASNTATFVTTADGRGMWIQLGAPVAHVATPEAVPKALVADVANPLTTA